MSEWEGIVLYPAAMVDVEKPKSETKITKNLDETEKNSQANLKDDRSSNCATNKTKDINEFNHTTQIKNKVTQTVSTRGDDTAD